jgi:hypothetical protein
LHGANLGYVYFNQPMFTASQEWSRSSANDGAATNVSPFLRAGVNKGLYRRLSENFADSAGRAQAAAFLQRQLALAQTTPCDLPDSAQELQAWMLDTARQATARYSRYLAQREVGAPRQFFTNRAHALYFLRSVAPTKLVDGAWLYGLLPHWRNPRFADLVRIYVDELGEGAPDKNHVLIYRQLLARHDLDSSDDLDDTLYTQGLIQLALGCNAEDFLPEVMGFNLGYEQLPLHLLITAYELNELGLDPYYFTLHVTVDNFDTGHAKRAVQAVLGNQPRLPRVSDANDLADDFWQRVRRGYQLGNTGMGSCEVIEGFDIEREVVRILAQKSIAGHGAHSDYCRVEGRHVNDWLARPEDIPAFLAALQRAGWIRRNAPVGQSRFWGLLQGSRAEMFGVFSGYELQVIYDWIRGDASADGRAYSEPVATDRTARRPGFRAASRLFALPDESSSGDTQDGELFDQDLQSLKQQLATLDEKSQSLLLVKIMSPFLHWTPAGLHATRLFCEHVI